MFLLVIGLISFLLGAALTVVGLVVWGILDFDIGEILCQVGLCMMVTPFAIGLLVGAFALLISLFGFVLLF